MSNDEGTIPEAKDAQDTKVQTLNDLVYSIETKTFLHFMKQLRTHNIFLGSIEIHDPLPQFDFDSIVEELKKRLPKMEKQKLEDTKIWIKEPLRRITELSAKTHRSLGEKHIAMDKIQLSKAMEEIEEINAYRVKLKTLIQNTEEILEREKGGKEKNIQQSTRGEFKQLHLFEPNDADS